VLFDCRDGRQMLPMMAPNYVFLSRMPVASERLDSGSGPQSSVENSVETKTGMTMALIFGSPEPGVRHMERLAAYVVINNEGKVALVKDRRKLFLPGGGSLSGETPEETVVREVREELARNVRLIRRMGEAIQYFYSTTDDRHYRMVATFFKGELSEASVGTGEHELHWLSVQEAERACFHACHAWAVRQA
jgi:8-oxo-dGTP pyrophosphatase MutT (NUDIX family)